MTAKEKILNNGYEDVIIFSNPSYDDALIGVTTDNIAVYSYEKMVEYLMRVDNMTEEDAIDWIDYNTIRSLPYTDNAPIIVYNLQE